MEKRKKEIKGDDWDSYMNGSCTQNKSQRRRPSYFWRVVDCGAKKLLDKKILDKIKDSY